MGKAPTFRHIALASLISAFSWTPLGRGKSKAYLDAQKDAVLASPKMRGALNDAYTGTPDEGETARRFYHHQKDLLPSLMEEARDMGFGEEMASKYIACCAVTAGFALGTALTALLAIATAWIAT